MSAWERVRAVVQCAYGCQIRHPEWAWFGRHPFVVCEPCAAKYGIRREALPPAPADALVPATPEPHVFTSMESIAAAFTATPEKVVRAAKRRRAR